jgi:energy-coupling factor transporter ATPase
MNRPDPPIIDVRDLWHTYLAGTPLETQSLRGVHLAVSAGDAVGIIGPTGSGKSTLLQHLNGLLRPQRGQVYVHGSLLSHRDADARGVRRNVGLVFQSPEDQLFERYAGDDVAFGPRNFGLSANDVRERVHSAMETVGLPFAYKDRLTLELSHGQRRLLALAGVLALEPQVLVLDEPTAGLDPQGCGELLRLLSRWRQGTGRALVLASHNMEDVAEVCTRVYVLVAGRVVLQGTPHEVFAQADLLAANGLTVPEPVEALLRLRARGCPVSTAVLTVEDAASAIKAVLNG